MLCHHCVCVIKTHPFTSLGNISGLITVNSLKRPYIYHQFSCQISNDYMFTDLVSTTVSLFHEHYSLLKTARQSFSTVTFINQRIVVPAHRLLLWVKICASRLMTFLVVRSKAKKVHNGLSSSRFFRNCFIFKIP